MEPILVRDFNKFTFGRWGKVFGSGMIPAEFESCDWRLGRRGRPPRFWDYVKHGACHWLVNHNLALAKAVLPDRPWHILTSQEHSTVFDGNLTLFDFNFLALGVSADEGYVRAMARGKPLRPGEFLEVHYADHFSIDLRIN